MADTRSCNSGRPATKELTNEERMKRLEHQVKLLKQENEFLKKSNFWTERQGGKPRGSNAGRKIPIHQGNNGVMKYITPKEAGEKWGISDGRIQLLCN